MDPTTLITSALDSAIDKSTQLSHVLFKVKALARLLKNEQLSTWVELEINGYQDAPIPPYRIVGALPRADLLHRHGHRQHGQHINLSSLDSETRDILYNFEMHGSLAEIEDFLSKSTNPLVYMLPTQAAAISRYIYEPQDWHIISAWRELPRTQLAGILDSVRSKVTDLLFDLQELDANVHLKAFSPNSAVNEAINHNIPHVSTGANSTVHITTGNQNTHASAAAGAHQNMAQGNNNAQSTSAEVASLHDLVAQVKGIVTGDPLFQKHQDEILSELHRIDVQLKREEPRKSVIIQAFDTIKDLAAEAAGKTTAHTIFQLLTHTPVLLAAAGLS